MASHASLDTNMNRYLASMQQLKPFYTNTTQEHLCVVALLQMKTGMSTSRIRKWIDAALIWSEGSVVLSSKSLIAPQRRCYIDLEFLDSKGMFLKVQPQILYDTPDWIALNKPAGCESLELKEIMSKELGVSLDLVHRLDRMTSGAIIMTKTGEAKRIFDRYFREQKLKKIYCGLCHTGKEPIELIPSISDQKWAFWQDTLVKKKDRLYSAVMVKALPGQKGETGTLYAGRIQAREQASLIAFQLQSGKMHQIRVQCQLRDLGIVGDRQYGPKDEQSKKIFASLAYGGHFLHAYLLKIPASAFGSEICIRAPFPKTWGQALAMAQIKGRALDRIINPSTPPEGRIFSQSLEAKIMSHSPKETPTKRARPAGSHRTVQKKIQSKKKKGR